MLEFRKDLFADERDDRLNAIGKPVQRQDMIGHVTARTEFYNDHHPAGMLHLKCLRSPHHHARIRSIDTAGAASSPGVRRVMTGRDVPVNLNTLLSLLQFGEDDEPSLATEFVRYRGEPVVAVVADSEAEAFAALDKIRVDYEPIPAVFDPEEALAPGAPVVNATYPNNYFVYHERYDRQKVRFGNVERAFREADQVIEGRYQMSPIEHAPTETNGAIAVPENNGRYLVYTCAQGLFFSLDTSAKILNVPSNRLHFVGGTVGGGFGGKVDTICEPLAILGAMLTGRPVRYMLGREEEMQVSSPRGAERWYLKDGVMADGRIVARSVRGYFDAGAYTRLSSYAVAKCAGHIPGPYTIANVSADIFCVFTNRTPASAMRGFGITGVDFAIECQMDRIAHAVGIDPVALRLINAYRDGDMKAHRRQAKNCALIECLQVAAGKAGVRLSDEMMRLSSREGGGVGWRGAIPETPLDGAGVIAAGAHDPGGSARPQQPIAGRQSPGAETGRRSPGEAPRSAVSRKPPAASEGGEAAPAGSNPTRTPARVPQSRRMSSLFGTRGR